jgi:hypothetical protein
MTGIVLGTIPGARRHHGSAATLIAVPTTIEDRHTTEMPGSGIQTSTTAPNGGRRRQANGEKNSQTLMSDGAMALIVGTVMIDHLSAQDLAREQIRQRPSGMTIPGETVERRDT